MSDVLIPPLPAPPVPRALARSVVGLGVLGLLAALHPDGAGLGTVGALPLATVGTAAITLPTLLVAAPALDLPLTTTQTADALAAGIGRAGRLAWGLTPLMAFAVATLELSLPLFCVLVAWVGIAGVGETARRIAATADPRDQPSAWFLTRALSGAWSLLAILVGARLALGALLS